MPCTQQDFEELLDAGVYVSSLKSVNNVALPPGYVKDLSSREKSSVHVKEVQVDDEKNEDLKGKKAWEIATGPAKSIPMNLIMSYMTGNSLQIINITVTFMLFWNPLKAIFMDTNSSFEALITKKNKETIFYCKFVFILCHIACMAIGVWKLYKMGLIPHTESDWLAWMNPRGFTYEITHNYLL